MSSAPRYAIYYAPQPDSALARFGTRWLGRDVDTGEAVAQPPVTGLTDGELARITREPCRYGFHGTLKAPFRLVEVGTERELATRLRSFAAGRQPFTASPLALAEIGGFLALVPGTPSPELEALAADCVREFDDLRALPTAAELARRRQGGLTANQQNLLTRWGYPYVMEEFRFHLTLTDKLPLDTRTVLKTALAPLVEPITQSPFVVDGITLFVQPLPDAPFTVLDRLPLGRT